MVKLTVDELKEKLRILKFTHKEIRYTGLKRAELEELVNKYISPSTTQPAPAPKPKPQPQPAPAPAPAPQPAPVIKAVPQTQHVFNLDVAEDLKKKLSNVSVFDEPQYTNYIMRGTLYSDDKNLKEYMANDSKVLTAMLREPPVMTPYEMVRQINLSLREIGQAMINILRMNNDTPPESILKYLDYIKQLIEYKKLNKGFIEVYAGYIYDDNDSEFYKDETGVDRFKYFKKIYDKYNTKRIQALKEKPAPAPAPAKVPVPLLKVEDTQEAPGFIVSDYDARGIKRRGYEPMSIRRQMRQHVGTNDPFDQLLGYFDKASTI